MTLTKQLIPRDKITKKVNLTLQVGKDDTYTSAGNTILEAINNLPEPKNLKNKAVIKINFDGKESIRHYTVPMIRRMFSVSANIRNYSRQLAAKHLELFWHLKDIT